MTELPEAPTITSDTHYWYTYTNTPWNTGSANYTYPYPFQMLKVTVEVKGVKVEYQFYAHDARQAAEYVKALIDLLATDKEESDAPGKDRSPEDTPA